MNPRVSIYFESKTCEPSEIPDGKSFTRWAAVVIEPSVEIGLRIVDSTEGERYNRRYRRRNFASNVLSFPFITEISEGQNYLGDVLMTAPVVVREAYEQNKPVLSHWAHLFIHALLHLQGYKHDTDIDARKMQAQESKIMTALGFTDPWVCDK